MLMSSRCISSRAHLGARPYNDGRGAVSVRSHPPSTRTSSFPSKTHTALDPFVAAERVNGRAWPLMDGPGERHTAMYHIVYTLVYLPRIYCHARCASRAERACETSFCTIIIIRGREGEAGLEGALPLRSNDPRRKNGALRGYLDLKARKHRGTLNNGCTRGRKKASERAREGERKGEKDVGRFFNFLHPLPPPPPVNS